MTLSPVESRNVIGVVGETYRTPGICSHPDCEIRETERHHIFRRSLITSRSYFVSIDGAEPIPHVVDLCRDHHRVITDNQAWIVMEDSGLFSWLDCCGKREDGTKEWLYVGDLNPQPASQVKAAVKRPKPKKEPGEKKPSSVVSIRVPNTEMENGAELLKDLIAQAGEKIGREPGCPPYFILVEVLAVFLRDAEAV